MRPNPIFPSLWRPVLWMGMERIPGALWILLTFLLVIMGLMLAGDYIATVLIVAGGTVGTVYLQRIAEQDPQFFRVWFRRLPRNTVYPARRTRIVSTGRASVDASPVDGTGRRAAGIPTPGAPARTPLNRLHTLRRGAGRLAALIERLRKRDRRLATVIERLRKRDRRLATVIERLRKRDRRKPGRDPRGNGQGADTCPDPGTSNLTESGKG